MRIISMIQKLIQISPTHLFQETILNFPNRFPPLLPIARICPTISGNQEKSNKQSCTHYSFLISYYG